MHTVMLLVETRDKQNAKASKINAFIKNGVDPIARSNLLSDIKHLQK